MDLMDVCGVVEAGDLHNKLLALNTRYETLRSHARARGRELAEKKRKLTQEVSKTFMTIILSMKTIFWNLLFEAGVWPE